MCAGPDAGGSTPSSVERESGVDSFTSTEQSGPVSRAGHSDLSAGEAFSITNNPFSSLSTPTEKAMAVGQAVLPGGFLVGALRANALRNPQNRSLLGNTSGNRTILGG
jgi:hypothetical protein|tara:strand:- start:2013 stop:2336 length:324 start_codon:yes stop_codon:yes gene_type:complete